MTLQEQPEPPLPLPLLLAGAAAFLTLGVIQAMYGPAFGLFSKKYGLELASVGLIASAHFLGSAFGPPLVGLALQRVSVRRAVVGALLVLIAGMCTVAFAPAWPVAVTGALVGGIGLGSVSGALNAAYAARGTQAVNLVNAMFGVGSMLSPLLVAHLGTLNPGWPFLTVAAFAALTLLAARLWGFPNLPVQTTQAAGGQGGGRVALFALLVACYVGLEVGFGAWGDKHLVALGVSDPALILSGYWGGLTLGRVLTGLFGGRFLPQRLVLASGALTTLCAVVAAAAPGSVAAGAYLLAGLALGPIFGTTLAWMAQQLPARWVAFLMMAGSLGGVLMPALLGRVFRVWGAPALPVALAAAGALFCVVCAVMQRPERQS